MRVKLTRGQETGQSLICYLCAFTSPKAIHALLVILLSSSNVKAEHLQCPLSTNIMTLRVSFRRIVVECSENGSSLVK